MRRWTRAITALAGLLASGTAAAHVGIHSAGDLAAGFTHPFLGPDHLLAMVAVGIWAAQLGGRRLLMLPAAFVTFMAVGASLGAAGVPLPQVEGMVAVSVLALGCAVGLSARLTWHWAVPLVAAFALFHGHAHGAEMPDFAAPWRYFLGFALATALLHAAGVAAVSAARTHPALVRAGGAAIALAGVWLVLSL
jgi:urease accessory protein